MKKKNLEHIFKKELQDFEVSPPEHLWENISKEITSEKKHKKVVPLWYAASGIAASLLLFYVFIFNSSNNDKIENIVSNEAIEYCPEEALVENNPSIENNDKELKNKESSIVTLSEKEKLIRNTDSLEGTSIKNSFITSLSEKKNSLNNDNSLAHKTKKVDSETSTVTFYEAEKEPSTSNSNRKVEATKNTSKSEYTINRNNELKNTDIAAFTESKSDIEKIKESNKQLILKKDISNDISPKKDLDKINELNDTELIALLIEENDLKEVKEESIKKWSIQPQVGSYGYTSLNGGSTINSEFNDNPQFTETGLNYGVRISFQVSPKIKIRTGFTYTNINIITQNIGITSLDFQPESGLFSGNNLDVGFVNLDNSGNSGFDSVEGISSEEIVDETPTIQEPDFSEVFVDAETEEIEQPTTPEVDEEAIFEPFSPTEEQSNTVSGNIRQKLEYLEFPIEASYNLIDKKIGLDIIGGFSAFVLTNNETIFENPDNNGNVFLGETTSLNNTSFSSNIGFSVDYNIAKNLSFNLEPIIKFQFNSFDNTTDYNPILFGLSSGIRWKF